MNELLAELAGRIAVLQHQAASLTETLAALAAASAGTPRGAAPPLISRLGSHMEQLHGYLLGRPGRTATRAELAGTFPDLNTNSLSGAIMRLKDRGLIEVLGRGRYRARLRSGT